MPWRNRRGSCPITVLEFLVPYNGLGFGKNLGRSQGEGKGGKEGPVQMDKGRGDGGGEPLEPTKSHPRVPPQKGPNTKEFPCPGFPNFNIAMMLVRNEFNDAERNLRAGRPLG